MPKYYEYKIAGYYLYFTSYCVIECMHVHASDRKLTEAGSAKFFVKDNGDTVLQNRGILNDREIRKIQEFIKQNYQEMYLKWSDISFPYHTYIAIRIYTYVNCFVCFSYCILWSDGKAICGVLCLRRAI